MKQTNKQRTEAKKLMEGIQNSERFTIDEAHQGFKYNKSDFNSVYGEVGEYNDDVIKWLYYF